MADADNEMEVEQAGKEEANGEEGEEEIDDEVLNEEKEQSGGDESTAEASDEGDEDEEEDDEQEQMERLIEGMPEDEKARLKEVVWAKQGRYDQWPAFIYHPADVNEKLRGQLYTAARAVGDGANTHQIVFFYNYGGQFAAIPFKNIEPWTEENKQKYGGSGKGKNKLPGAITKAEEDSQKPKDDRAPGPPDKSYERKRTKEAKRKKREALRQAKSKGKKKQKGKAPKAGSRKRKKDEGEEEDEEEDDEEEEEEESEAERGRKKKGHQKKCPQKTETFDRSHLKGTPKERAVEKLRAWWSKYGRSYPALVSGADEENNAKKSSTEKRKSSTGGSHLKGKKSDVKSGDSQSKSKKHKKDFEKESEAERFSRLSRNLSILLEDKPLNVPKICSTLDKLALITVTISQLTENGIGQIVKGLRKHTDADIQAKAKHAFGKWKESVKDGPAAAAVASATAGGKLHSVSKKEDTPQAPVAPVESPAAPPGAEKEKKQGPEQKENGKGTVADAASKSSVLPAAPSSEGPQEEPLPLGDSQTNGARNGFGVHPAAAFPPRNETSKRQRTCSLVKQVLGDMEGSSALPIQVEEFIYNQRKGRGTDDKYLSYVRSLCAAVKAQADLRKRFIEDVEGFLTEFFLRG